MSTAPAVPEIFAHLVDLASDAAGAFAVFATDDYFAEKENLLKPTAPVWIDDRYTDKGKWMDGWESQRRREPGDDFCIVRLAMPGRVHGLLVDTTHFKGNAPEQVSFEVIDVPDPTRAAVLVDHQGWREVLPRTPVRPDHRNVLSLEGPSPRASHVRLRIHPDGGVARLRVYGVVEPDPFLFWRPGSVDLAAVEHGGTIPLASDQFFGPPSNLLLPGRGVNMGDGWETKRRRTPGSDWCVIRLGRRGVVERLEIDTHFFKGNAPQATLVEAFDETEHSVTDVAKQLGGKAGWIPLVGRTPLAPHRRHFLQPDRPIATTHLRVHIFPHGGVNRLRAWGRALDRRDERRALASFHAMSEQDARTLLLSFAGSSTFADRVQACRPLANVRDLFAVAEDALWSLDTDDWLEAFAAHPRLGQKKPALTQTDQSAAWSRGEQAGLSGTPDDTAERLAAANDRYFEKFGFIFILFAMGRTAREVLEQLEQRLENDRDAEIENAAREQAKITRLRIGKFILGN